MDSTIIMNCAMEGRAVIAGQEAYKEDGARGSPSPFLELINHANISQHLHGAHMHCNSASMVLVCGDVT